MNKAKMDREFTEEIILNMANIVLENRMLRDKVEYLENVKKQHEDYIDERYKETKNQVDSIFTAILEKAIKQGEGFNE